jgi:hypothetical protein
MATQSLLSNYMTSSKGILGRTFSALAKVHRFPNPDPDPNPNPYPDDLP